MQITLTPQAEESLRVVLVRHPGQSPEQIVEQALAEHANQTAASIEDPVWKQLSTIPGIEMPDQWPPQFAKFESLQVEGEPVSEQLIRDRR